MNTLCSLLTLPPDPSPIADLNAYWQRHTTIVASATPIERALLGGFLADRLAYVFAAGYQAALRVLVPALAHEEKACLSATEAAGAHPRAIETTLVPDPDEADTFRLTGHKRWATISGERVVLLVVATTGRDDAQRQRLRVARVASDAPGVTLEAMETPAFAPEIGHSQVHLDNVRVSAGDLLPGDGYEKILKPFRTFEDIYVTLALLGYVVREVRMHALPTALAERAIALASALQAIASGDTTAPDAHVALAGVLAFERALLTDFEGPWSTKAPEAHERFLRDRPLLGVAGSARAKRLERAWERLAET